MLSVVFGASLAVGGLLWIAPGSPANAEDGPGFLGWFVSWWWGVLRLDLGQSYRGYPVTMMVSSGARVSFPLVGMALLVSLVVSLFLVWLFRSDRPRLNQMGRGLLQLSSLMPVFLLGYLGLIYLAVPPEGIGMRVFAVLVLALGNGNLTDVFLQLDDETRRLTQKDFVWSAIQKRTGVLRTLAPSLVLPIATLMANKIGFLIGGVLVIEMVLGIQGLGYMGYKAASRSDHALLIAITVLVAAVIAFLHFLTDVLRIVIDPRVRRSS